MHSRQHAREAILNLPEDLGYLPVEAIESRAGSVSLRRVSSESSGVRRTVMLFESVDAFDVRRR